MSDDAMQAIRTLAGTLAHTREDLGNGNGSPEKLGMLFDQSPDLPNDGLMPSKPLDQHVRIE